MSDHDALLAAICANPREDTPRLVFADWLEEHGQAERAAFIRTDVAMAHHDEWDAERIRWEALLTPANLLAQPWFAVVFPPLPRGLTWFGYASTRRGFPRGLEVRYPEVGVRELPDLLTRHPVEVVAFLHHSPDLRQVVKVRGLDRVRALAFGAPHYSTRHLEPILGGVLGELKGLTFWNDALRTDAVVSLFASPFVTRLTELRFSRTGAAAGRAILDGLRDAELPRLRVLELRGSLPGTDGVQMLAARRIPESVRSLDLAANQLSSERIQLLAGRAELANLKSLILAGNPLGNAGATTLFTSPHLAGLKVLDLSYCQVGDEALRALLDNSPLADGLNLLNLTGSPASAETKQAVKDRMGDRVRL
jgi:uncharacterized protein (TIGR02996 family)